MAGNLGFPSGFTPGGGGTVGFGYTTLSPESANNPNTVAGPYPYGAGMDFGVGSAGFIPQAPDWGMGSAGFPSPPVTGPNYQYGTGMGFGLPDLGAPDPRIAQEADRNRLEAERQALERARGGMNFGLTDVIDNRRQQEEDRRWAEENRRSVEAGLGEIAPQQQYAVESGILEGGYDPGDMGDAATTQGHTDYMNSARAMYAQTVREAQERAAAAEAERQQFYAYQRLIQLQQQQQFNQNITKQNPTSIFDTWAAGQSTQYQPY